MFVREDAFLASDADSIRGIALSENLGLFPRRRPEEKGLQSMLHGSVNTVSEPVDVSGLSDERLMSHLLNEDPDALDVLFTRYSRLVYSIALRILRDPGEAEEVVQDCFFYVYRKACTFEPSRGSAKVWIVQVAYSRARDRKAHLLRTGFYLRTGSESRDLEGTLIGNADLEQDIGQKIDFNRLKCALEDLSAIQRTTLKLFYFEDLDLREISEHLREPLGNVRHHFYRGLERLRKNAIAERLRNYHNGKN